MKQWGVLALLLCWVGVSGAMSPWDPLTEYLEWEIRVNKTFPGAVAAVADETGFLYLQAVGNFTYGLAAPQNNHTNPPMDVHTLFDLASVTKVLATTAAVMWLTQKGHLGVGDLVSSPELLGSAYAQNGKGSVQVMNCLLHNAGYPPDPIPGYSYKQFGCPATAERYPREVFTCRDRIFEALLAQKLVYPVGSKYVYSDLSMITLMYVVGRVAKRDGLVAAGMLRKDCVEAVSTDVGIYECYYEAFVRKNVLSPNRMFASGFLPPKEKWGEAAPAWFDPKYRHRFMQGQVSDPNAFALGGVAGHAGLFSNVLDMSRAMHSFLFPQPGRWLNQTTISQYTTVHNTSQSSRAFGWDTNNYQANTYRGCGTLSSRTFTHMGYTGTQVCGDPERKIYTVMLTNRCYPDDSNDSRCRIHWARTGFNTKVQEIYDGLRKAGGDPVRAVSDEPRPVSPSDPPQSGGTLPGDPICHIG